MSTRHTKKVRRLIHHEGFPGCLRRLLAQMNEGGNSFEKAFPVIRLVPIFCALSGQLFRMQGCFKA